MNVKMFSAKDLDNDPVPFSCAEIFEGGWWYNAGYYVNLNGIFSYHGFIDLGLAPSPNIDKSRMLVKLSD